MGFKKLVSIGILFFSFKALAIAEFGTLHSSSPGKVVITVNDGTLIKKNCVVEVTVKDKKIHWISHPLTQEFVKRDPKFIYNFNEKYLLMGSVGKDDEGKTNAQLHLYTKGDQTLDLLAESECTERAEIKVENNSATFNCGSKNKTVKFEKSLNSQIAPAKLTSPIEFKEKVMEVKDDNWRFEIAETDNYFKDRLLIVQRNQILKEYKAQDFQRCFEYETLKGSQDKFNE